MIHSFHWVLEELLPKRASSEPYTATQIYQGFCSIKPFSHPSVSHHISDHLPPRLGEASEASSDWDELRKLSAVTKQAQGRFPNARGQPGRDSVL